LSAKGIRAPVSSVPLYSRARIHHAGLRGATRLELIRIAASRPDDVLHLRTRGLGFDKRQDPRRAHSGFSPRICRIRSRISPGTATQIASDPCYVALLARATFAQDDDLLT
jgi:hypothetical protein